jgi:transcriptional regulator with XRE-family HTH domain
VTAPNTLGEYLRARRELVDPSDVGLHVAGVRRTPGLRREEVATLAGISADYYLRLEQGRDRNPSPQVLTALARVLGLDATATSYLLSVAAIRPARTRTKAGRQENVPASIRQLISAINLPAFVESRMFDVLAANPRATALSPSMRGAGLRGPRDGRHRDCRGRVGRGRADPHRTGVRGRRDRSQKPRTTKAMMKTTGPTMSRKNSPLIAAPRIPSAMAAMTSSRNSTIESPRRRQKTYKT